ncbi:MAG: shikimate dehydrogenase [Oscillospiraceae bacterium]|nr:shikimate dehydrogenase [Oscillospiraceae bacterium]
MKKFFGLIGEKLSHSFSPFIQNGFAASLGIDWYNYQKYELRCDELDGFFNAPDFGGVNVTIPYKKAALKYCDELSDVAREIGCVNLVYKRDGKFYGDNCDYYGLSQALAEQNIDLKDKNILILGTGATSLTAAALCKNLNAREILKVSRSGSLCYENVHEQTQAQVIINTSPAGMYPDTATSLIQLERFPNLYAVVDVVANPLKTRLLLQAQERGVKFVGGLSMMVHQARKSAEILLNSKISDTTVKQTMNALFNINRNIVLVGMPGSGKTEIGKILAAKLPSAKFTDTDSEIERNENMPISEIFKQKGEEYFRECEKRVIEKCGKEHNLIISTGGGAVLDRENRHNLRQNGVVFYIERAIEKLACDQRPLSKDTKTLKKLLAQREPLYKECADKHIENNADIESAAKEILTVDEKGNS